MISLKRDKEAQLVTLTVATQQMSDGRNAASVRQSQRSKCLPQRAGLDSARTAPAAAPAPTLRPVSTPSVRPESTLHAR